MIKENSYYKLMVDDYVLEYRYIATIQNDTVKGILLTFGEPTKFAVNSNFQYNGNYKTKLSILESVSDTPGIKFVEIDEKEFDEALKNLEDLVHGIRTDFIS